MNIYAAAIMVHRNIPNGIESAVVVITFTTTNEESAKLHIWQQALKIYPIVKGFHSHRTSYCVVTDKAINAYLNAQVINE